jgi:hypothetical protein
LLEPLLACLVVLTGGAALAACGPVSTSSSAGGSSTGPGVNSAAATATADAAINWQTVTEISGSSTSQGGGTNHDTSESSTTVSGAYRIIAACQGSGSLQITLKPGGSVALPCTSSAHDPVRIAGGDSAPPDGTLDITVDRQGDVQSSEVEVQVRA